MVSSIFQRTCTWVATRATALAASLGLASAQKETWIAQLGTIEEELAETITGDGHGGAFVAGHIQRFGPGGKPEYQYAWVARYAADGTLRWFMPFGSQSADFPMDSDFDEPEGLYLTGFTLGDLAGVSLGNSDAWLIHFDLDGAILWAKQFGTSSSDGAHAAGADGAGGVLLAGWTSGLFGARRFGKADAWVARFDGNGGVTWVQQLGTVADDEATALAVSDGGDVYVAGDTSGSIDGATPPNHDVWVARFDGNGAQQWIRQFGVVTGIERATGMASGPSRSVYVCGQTSASLGGPFAGALDAWLALFDADGDLRWVRQLGTSDIDLALGVAEDGTGGVYLTGRTEGDLGALNLGSSDPWLARYTSAGDLLWLHQFGSTSSDSATDAAPDGLDGVLLAGSTYGWMGGPSNGLVDAWLARYDGSCNPGETYCVASSTSIAGCAASISATGSPTMSDPTTWTVSSGPVPGANLGLLLFGSSGKDNTPYGTLGGQLCVASPTFRTAPESSGGDQGQCNGGYVFTLADVIAASPIVTSGATVNAQVWARDPANQDGFLLSDGLEATICP